MVKNVRKTVSTITLFIIILLLLVGFHALSRIKLGTPDPSVDIDLTVYSNTMVYSELQQMNLSLSDYNGKTVKINGKINTTDGKNYIEFSDLTGCCSIREYFTMNNAEEYTNLHGKVATLIGTFDNGIIVNCRIL